MSTPRLLLRVSPGTSSPTQVMNLIHDMEARRNCSLLVDTSKQRRRGEKQVFYLTHRSAAKILRRRPHRNNDYRTSGE